MIDTALLKAGFVFVFAAGLIFMKADIKTIFRKIFGRAGRQSLR